MKKREFDITGNVNISETEILIKDGILDEAN